VNLKPRRDRSPVWLPLLTRLTRTIPSWGMWKSADSAFFGNGDIDSVASSEDLPLIEAEFARWAGEQKLGPVIVCPHAAPFMRVLVALDKDQRSLLELDLTLRKTFHGATLFVPADLVPLMSIDEQGVRKIRPGAEGVILLLHNGMRKGGLPNREGLQGKRVVELLQQDPVGIEAAAQLFGPGASAVSAGARSLIEGHWNRRAMVAVEAWSLLRALKEPGLLLARTRFRFVTKQRCPLLKQVYGGRRVPSNVDVDTWIGQVADTHQVHGLQPGLRDEPAPARPFDEPR
jgi:hypothetical protein